MRKEERGLKITAYVLTSLAILIIVFPFLLMFSYSMMDSSAVYRLPPRILPEIPKSVGIVIDYTGSRAGEEELKNEILEDSIASLFVTYFETQKDSVGEVKVYGTMDGKTIFYQRAHTMEMKMISKYTTYQNVAAMNRQTLFYNDRHKKAADAIGYQFDLSGVSEAYAVDKLGKNEWNDTVISYLTDESKNRGIHGSIQSTILGGNAFLMLENFMYYIKVPSYMFPDDPLIEKLSFFAFLFNTLLVILWALITQIGLCSLTAFGISRLVGRKTGKILMFYFLFTLMIPFMCIIMPQLIMMQGIHAVDNYAAMLLPYLYPAAFYIFLFKGFFDRLPQSLFDAANIDGASQWYAFTRICMPLSKPIISVIAINVIVAAWGDFTWYLMAANKPELWTINLALYSISTGMNSEHNLMFGLSVVTIVPVMAVTLIFSKQIKESIANAGIKG